MPDISIIPIPAFDDNYIWCLRNTQDCLVVDPGDAKPVLAYCQQHNLTLQGILVTHHHWDHTNGIDELLQAFPDIVVFGPAKGKTQQVTFGCEETDEITLPALGLSMKVLEVPGHTLDHIAYVSDLGLFCGDTLFSGGCGRLFEGTPGQMHQSLSKLAALDPDLPVFCTHEYTLANLKFAQAVEKSNQALNDYVDWAKLQRQQNRPTLPSSIGQEKAINPFLRVTEPEVLEQAEKRQGGKITHPEQAFAALRNWKDHF